MNSKKNYSKEEWLNRVDLAACYHLAHHFGWTDIIWKIFRCLQGWGVNMIIDCIVQFYFQGS